jgi:anion-transporting  ArsA/GET3 family ATPase
VKVRIFLGTGGVGKTSVAAASGLQLALAGGRWLVITIDPAARLKTALGMGTGGEHRRVPLDEYGAKGELWVAQLDVQRGLEQMVRRLAKPDDVDAILNNRIYHALESLAGMQELMAVETIGKALTRDFDGIMVDTAPSRHALEFLDKPEYLVRLVSAPMTKLVGRTYGWWKNSPLGMIGRKGLDLYGQIEKIVGGELLSDVLEFFSVFQAVAEGYARDAEKTLGILRGPDAGGVTIVTSPLKARGDAGWFLAELQKRKFRVDRMVINRVWPKLSVSAQPDADESARAFVDWYHSVSAAHADAVETARREFSARIPRIEMLPELPADVDGIAALVRIAASLPELREAAR